MRSSATLILRQESSDSDSDSEDSKSDDDSSDSSDASEDEEAAADKSTKKRKADAEPTEAPAKKAKTADNAGGIKNLFVGNLSWNVDEEWLNREFESFGEITGVRIISDRATGRSKGFGYVEFADADAAAAALAAKNGTEIDGRAANIDFSTPRSNDGPKQNYNDRAAAHGDSLSAPSDTLFIGNVAFEATEDIIGEAFGQYGNVVHVRLPTSQ